MSDIVVADLGRMPVLLLTGYLGSGKTTVLNRLLVAPAFSRATVVINEFGDAPLDPLFVEKTNTELALMQNRCLCCEIQEDVEGVIGRLFGRRTSRLLAFDRMVIETSGIADPAPIMQVLFHEPRVAANFRLERVVTVVDAVNCLRQLEEHEEARRQVMLADRLVISKSDLCDERQLIEMDRRLEALNPAALRMNATHGNVPPEWLLGGTEVDEQALRRRVSRTPVLVCVFHRPRALPHLADWRGTNLVLIMRDTDTAAIGAGWDAFVKSRVAPAAQE